MPMIGLHRFVDHVIIRSARPPMSPPFRNLGRLPFLRAKQSANRGIEASRETGGIDAPAIVPGHRADC
jgi:hypothetical protein